MSLVVMLSIWSVPVMAEHPDDLYREQSDFGKMFHKLGRGVVNVFTCWIEIPKNIAKEWSQYDPFTGFILGTCKGFAWGAGRLATGLYDTVTFPLPIPKGYVPLIEPEFVLTDIWGESVDFYQSE